MNLHVQLPGHEIAVPAVMISRLKMNANASFDQFGNFKENKIELSRNRVFVLKPEIEQVSDDEKLVAFFFDGIEE